MKQLSDTSPEAERVLIDVYRKMSVAQKWRILGGIFRTAKSLHAAGMRLRKPEATPEEIRDDWVIVTHGESALKVIEEARRGDRKP